jgi:hypothetical protein
VHFFYKRVNQYSEPPKIKTYKILIRPVLNGWLLVKKRFQKNSGGDLKEEKIGVSDKQ